MNVEEKIKKIIQEHLEKNPKTLQKAIVEEVLENVFNGKNFDELDTNEQIILAVTLNSTLTELEEKGNIVKFQYVDTVYIYFIK